MINLYCTAADAGGRFWMPGPRLHAWRRLLQLTLERLVENGGEEGVEVSAADQPETC